MELQVQNVFSRVYKNKLFSLFKYFDLLLNLLRMFTAQTHLTSPRSTLHHGLFSSLLCANDLPTFIDS